ncbi:MAG: hypothetical protein R2856_32860 [Caldilineaceae bacterium]
MFDAQYEADKAIIIEPTHEFVTQVAQRTTAAVEAARKQTQSVLTILVP